MSPRLSTPHTKAFPHWLKTSATGVDAKSTRRIYQGFVEEFVYHFGDPVRATLQDVTKWRERIETTQRGEKAAAVTVNSKITALWWLFEMLKQHELRTDNPTDHLKGMKRPKLRPRPFEDEEIRDIRRAIDSSDSPFALMYRAIVETLYGSLVRRNEAAHVRLADINPWQRLIRVASEDAEGEAVGKNRKERMTIMTAVQYRVVRDWALTYYGDETTRKLTETQNMDVAFRELIERKGDKYLFVTEEGVPLANLEDPGDAIYYRVKKFTEGTPHQFRHSGATGLWNNGAEIYQLQQLLGHDDPRTTMGYAELRPKAMEELSRKHPGNEE